jgi:hypothetical protein
MPWYNIYTIQDRIYILHIKLNYMYKEENISTLGAELIGLQIALYSCIMEVLGWSF